VLQAEKAYNICTNFKAILQKEKLPVPLKVSEHQFCVIFSDWDHRPSILATTDISPLASSLTSKITQPLKLLEKCGDYKKFRKGELLIEEETRGQWLVCINAQKIGIYRSSHKCGELDKESLYVYQVLSSRVIEPFSLKAEEDMEIRTISRVQLQILAISQGHNFATSMHLYMCNTFFRMIERAIRLKQGIDGI